MKLLLHVCCGPCATAAIERLRKDGHDMTLFFAGSNIAPQEEYERRLAAAKKLADILSLPIIEDDYLHGEWLTEVAGLEHEPEKGARCPVCFRFNLERTARYAKEHGFEAWTTTLTISPHKDAQQIFAIGKDLGGFLAIDFKKQDGFKKSCELSMQHKLYRQQYCGCEFSTKKK